MKRLLLAGLLAASAPALAQTRPPQPNPDSLRVVWADVDHFWTAFDHLAAARSTADSLAVIERDYLAPATPGLRAYAEAANAKAPDFLRALRTHRRYLAAIRPATQAIASQRPAIGQAARALKKAYPGAVFPDIYFAVGKFEVGGSPLNGLLYVGAELKCATPTPPLAELRPDLRGGVSPLSAISTVCVHEIIHGQQRPGQARTNLALALLEGAAEYVAYRLTGRLGAAEAVAYGRQHEAAVRQQFARAAEQPAEARWFLATADAATGQPGALGYFIGFRICEAYYTQARDKKAALEALIALSDRPGLLAQGRQYLAR
ncbi:hypothetical protein [Hymenobacter armeniacus]|uniref:DUF2268 domain-containing protein n=1 Tax=Hymenobacter armeniacus TaxID=2771358 RepID=A0ABR8JNN6_9BACT|nr:hypothetical protein [Hymenobacter armeniacus]MBD2721609.1 hypothetical protein [Hymenobacter armeniacus]